MSVQDILSDEFLAELPDDPQMAFGKILRRVDEYVADACQAADTFDGGGRYAWETAQHTAMNTIIGAAKRLGIEPFASMAVPMRKGFDSEQFVEFKADLDHYAVQILLDNSIRSKRDAVAIGPKIKDRLRGHVHGIRTLIDQADLPEPRRALLRKRIADFEEALEKPRVNVAMLAGLLVTILAGSASVAQLADSQAMHRLVTTIMVTIGQAKAIDDEKRELLETRESRPLLPPRSKSRIAGEKKEKEIIFDIDDEIPF